jgi:hypothetical protein
MGQNETESNPYVGRKPEALRSLLAKHSEKTSYYRAALDDLKINDINIRVELSNQEYNAIHELEGVTMDDNMLLSVYEGIAVNFEDSYLLQHIDSIVERREQLLPGVPFVAKKEGILRKVADVAQPVRYVVEPPVIEHHNLIEPDLSGRAKRFGLLALSVLSTDVHSSDVTAVTLGLHDEVGQGPIESRLTSLYFRRNVENTLQTLEEAIERFEFIDDIASADKARTMFDRIVADMAKTNKYF